MGKAEIQEALSMMKSEYYPQNLSSRLLTCKLKELQIDLNDGTITKVYDRSAINSVFSVSFNLFGCEIS